MMYTYVERFQTDISGLLVEGEDPHWQTQPAPPLPVLFESHRHSWPVPAAAGLHCSRDIQRQSQCNERCTVGSLGALQTAVAKPSCA